MLFKFILIYIGFNVDNFKLSIMCNFFFTIDARLRAYQITISLFEFRIEQINLEIIKIQRIYLR